MSVEQPGEVGDREPLAPAQVPVRPQGHGEGHGQRGVVLARPSRGRRARSAPPPRSGRSIPPDPGRAAGHGRSAGTPGSSGRARAARRPPRRSPSAAPARTGEGVQQPEPRGAAGVRVPDEQRLVDEGGEVRRGIVRGARQRPRRPASAWRRRRRGGRTPAASARGAGRGSSATMSRRVRWRAGASNRRLANCSRASRRAVSSAGPSARSWPAASSRASGSPSRARQMSGTRSRATSSSSTPWRRTRSSNSRQASSSGSGARTRTRSPSTPRGCRLVARTRAPGQRAHHPVDQLGAPGEQVLAVVEHQEQPAAVGQGGEHRRFLVVRPAGRRRPGSAPAGGRRARGRSARRGRPARRRPGTPPPPRPPIRGPAASCRHRRGR